MLRAIQVEGVGDLTRALRQVEGGAADLRQAHAEGAEIVAEEARTLVPVRRGILRADIRSSGQIGQGVVRAGRASVPYAGPIHFGWAAHNIEPQPFLYDAADARTDEVRDTFREQLAKLAQSAGLATT